MENWLYDWKTVNQMTSHYKTGESLPKKMFLQIQKGRHFIFRIIRNFYNDVYNNILFILLYIVAIRMQCNGS